MGELARESQHEGLYRAMVPPYLYELLFEIASYGPLRAGEFRMSRRSYGSPRGTANSLRRLLACGLVERDDVGTYSLTPKAVEWLEVPRG